MILFGIMLLFRKKIEKAKIAAPIGSQTTANETNVAEIDRVIKIMMPCQLIVDLWQVSPEMANAFKLNDKSIAS